MTCNPIPKFRTIALGTALAVATTLSIGVADALPLPGTVEPQALTSVTREHDVHQVQYRGGPYRGYAAPRAYGGPRGYYAPGPRYYGGGPRAWGYRPWAHRPYYGTIIGGLALGTIIGVTAYGLAPRAPRPDMCWYWADEIQSRGYWDYC